ncbi:hypothetical protein [Nostoc sp. MG11]|uniref:hypothetical protein n=1 Tax=Nostoc sp. MG11 TaxID=2721166 RepID=UPI001866117A|nr:hypothetical protein [Nostoc sp. MG11]
MKKNVFITVIIIALVGVLLTSCKPTQIADRSVTQTPDQSIAQTNNLGIGEHDRILTVGGLKRTYLVHVPNSYDGTKPYPIVTVGDRIRRLRERENLEEAARAVLKYLGELKRPYLTTVEEKLLSLIEQEYGMIN